MQTACRRVRGAALVGAVAALTLTTMLVPTRARADAAPVACSLLTSAEIQQVLGLPTADGIQGITPLTCKWTVAGGRPTGGTVDLTLYTGPRAELGYQELRQTYQSSAQDQTGLGVAAFWVGGLGGTLFAEASPVAYFSLIVSFPSAVLPTDQVESLTIGLARPALPRAVAAGATPTTTTTLGRRTKSTARHGSLFAPPTSDLTDNLGRRVHAKQWKLSDGIRQTLAAALDTQPASATQLVTSRRKLVSGDVTGTVLLAQQYLATAPDTKTTRAIAAELARLVPTAAQLEALAKPLAGGPGKTAHRQTTGACSELWEGSEDTAALPGGCLKVDETTALGARLRIYTPTTPPAGFDSASFVTNVRKGFVDSTTKYSSFGRVGDIDVLFDPRGDPKFDGFASVGPSGSCVVLMEPDAVSPSPQYLQYVVAHELFHCWQQVNAPAYFDDYESGKWWIEGTAEHFANVVYPTYDFEYLQLGDLVEDEPGHSLVDLSYSAFLFWQEFANERGDGAVAGFIKAIPSGGRDAQIAALAGLSGVADLFDTYARNFIAGEIPDTSGEVHPFSPHLDDEAAVSDIGPFMRVQTQPFVIHRLKAIFVEDRTFETEIEADDAVRSAASPAWAREWGELPSPIDTKCGAHPYIIEATNATTDPAGFVAKITDASDHKCEIDHEVDECLVGLWRLDNVNFDDAFRPIAGTALSLLPTTGAMDMRFAPDGTGGTFNNGFEVSYVDKKLVAPKTLTVRIAAQGKSVGRWSAARDHIDFAGSGAALRFVLNFDVDGKVFPPTPLPFSTDTILASTLGSQEGSGSYQCHRDDMELTMDGSPLGTLHWFKVS